MRHHRSGSGRLPSLSLLGRLVVGVGLVVLALVIIVWVDARNDLVVERSLTPFETLRRVSVLEMPAQAVSIVAAGDVNQQDSLIVASLKSVSSLARPGIMPSMVCALIDRFPAKLELILDSAADIYPDQDLVLAQTCARRYPARVAEISCVLTQRTPSHATDLTKVLVSETGNSAAVLQGVQMAREIKTQSMPFC